MVKNKDAVKFAELALTSFVDNMGLEECETPENRVWHFLAALCEYCDARSVDLDAELSQVRQHFTETEPVKVSA